MNNRSKTFTSALVMAIVLALTGSCKKDEVKPVTTVTDIDGNVYRTVTIGTQEWMAENLRVTHYRNGNLIARVDADGDWANIMEGAYCNYDNNLDNNMKYGSLYNWFAINDSRNIAPPGWHVPEDVDWTRLVNYLGGEKAALSKMKTDNGWPENGSNESGFSGLPAGRRNEKGKFSSIEENGFWWTATVGFDSTFALSRMLLTGYTDIITFNSFKQEGFSVRCVKD